MLAGHYATALLAHQKYPARKTLLFFLIASQAQDLGWFALHYLGLETTTPVDIFDATIQNLSVDMLYSHDLFPQLFWIALVFGIGKLLFKDSKIAFMGAALVLGHFVLDIFSGHPHHFFGNDTQSIAFGLYKTNIYLAIGIEALFSSLCLWVFFKRDSSQGIERSRANTSAIIGLFVFGVVFMLSTATTSFRQLFEIPQLELGFNTNVPTLVLTYLTMIFYLNHVVSKASQ